MTAPTVTELARPLEPVTRDSFIDDLPRAPTHDSPSIGSREMEARPTWALPGITPSKGRDMERTTTPALLASCRWRVAFGLAAFAMAAGGLAAVAPIAPAQMSQPNQCAYVCTAGANSTCWKQY